MWMRISTIPVLFLILPVGDAHAYVDPAAHGTLVQVISGIVILLSAGYVFLKNAIAGIFKRLSGLFRRSRP